LPSSTKLDTLEKLIVNDAKLRITLASYVLVLVFLTNAMLTKSPAIGSITLGIYFLINGTFLANAFFPNEYNFVKLAFGALLLIMLLGLVGWVAMIAYDLDIAPLSAVLLITSTISSLLNREMRPKNVRN